MIQEGVQAVSAGLPWEYYLIELLPWIPSVLTIFGWIMVYWGQLVAQRKAFLLSTRKEAWMQLHKAILDYQKLLLGYTGRLYMLSDHVDKRPPTDAAGAPAASSAVEWSETLPGDAAQEWLFLLEHFEVLFSATALLRLQLANIHMLIQESLHLSRQLMFVPSHNETMTVGDISKALEPALQRLPLLNDQIALMYDLLIYLQNFVFEGIAEYAVPPRHPDSTSAVRIGFAANDSAHKSLHIVDGHGVVHDAAISPQKASLVEPDWLPRDSMSC
jgi:hypothetical protein